MQDRKSSGLQLVPLLLSEVSGDHFCASCHFLSGWRVLQRPSLVYFYSFLFLLFLLAHFRLQGGAGELGESALSKIVPVYGPADPTSLLLNTLAHNGGSVTQGPNLLLPSPQKQETGIGRALVFLLISCFATPSPDYFLCFFWFLSGSTYLINFLSSGNKLLQCSHEGKQLHLTLSIIFILLSGPI